MLSLVAFSHLQFSQIRGRQPYLIVRKILYVIRHVHMRMQGATPPNVYNLTLRERLFHGVRAIRLNPVDDSRMYGRAGILAHPYMLGENGQSNGCVSFSDYPEFLNAFLRGEVTRLVVVERLERPPGKFAAGQLADRGRDELRADRSFQYAAANY